MKINVDRRLQAALPHSLAIKRAEAGLPHLTVWGRINTRNGKDYLVATSCPSRRAEGDSINADVQYYFSQDGLKWVDLPSASTEQADVSAQMRDILTGDPQKKHFWPPKKAEEEGVYWPSAAYPSIC
jgi:hypothetical protein